MKKIHVDAKEKAAETELLSKLKQKITTLDNKLKDSKNLSNRNTESLASTSPKRQSPNHATPTTTGTKASPAHSDRAAPIPSRRTIRDASSSGGEGEDEKKGEGRRSEVKVDGGMSSKGVKKIRVVKKMNSCGLFANV